MKSSYLISVAVTQSWRTGLCSKSSALGLAASVEKAILEPDSIENFWLEFWLEKPLEFLLEIPYTKKKSKN